MGLCLCHHSDKIFDKEMKMKNIEEREEAPNLTIPLTSESVDLLKTSWDIVKSNWLNICVTAYKRWFTTYPELIRLFSKSKDPINVDDLLEMHIFHFHFGKISEVLRKIIFEFDSREKVINNLIKYGEMHYRFGAEQKYAVSLTINLKYAICTLNDFDIATESAWDSLLRFISGLLKYGIRKEEVKTKRTRSITGKAPELNQTKEEGEKNEPQPLTT